jgi:phospholipid/cholesterol/gamma-HCH transport system substrate-binding protein
MPPERGGDPKDGGTVTPARIFVLAAMIIGLGVAAFLMFRGGGGYTVSAEFENAGQLVKGNQVKVAGTAVGSVKSVDVTSDGHAIVKFSVDDKYAPLRRGTKAIVKQTSLSGIANRYIDLELGPQTGSAIDDGGRLGPDETSAAVEIDQIFNLLNGSTRKSLKGVLKGSADMLRGRGTDIQRGTRYLNPALSTGSRLFGELTRDTPLLERFLVDSSRLVTALAAREDDLAGVVSNLNTTFGALGSQKDALAESIDLLPPFMRRANTTFVNLRAALDDVDPLVTAARPVARRLGPFLNEARGFAAGARPTVRDLRVTLRRRGRRNDLTELMTTFPPLARLAVDRRQVNGAERRGAFPETADALKASAPTIALGRPYTNDFVGWLDDFSDTGGYDALGGFSRAFISLNEILQGPGPKKGQYRRCPGANELPAPDRSNVLSADEASRLDCDPSQRSVGP